MNFPKPKHVPGTTMTLHTDSPQFPWQQSTSQAMKKSVSTPGSLSSGSYQSPGQISPGQQMFPWLHQSQMNVINPGQGHSQGSGQSHSPNIELIQEEGDLDISDKKMDYLKSKVTFSLTDSSSSKSTESGFSEHLGKPETYASVCTNCRAAMAELDKQNKAYRHSADASHKRKSDKYHNDDSQSVNRSCDECNHHGNEHWHKHKDPDQRDLHYRNRQHGQGRGQGHYQGHYRDQRYKDEGHYYHKDRQHHQSQDQGSRRGYRGGYRGNRGYKRDFYHHHDLDPQKGHSSEPLLEANQDNNRPYRRTVSSPDKTFEKDHTEFTFDNNTNDRHYAKERTRNEKQYRHKHDRNGGSGCERSRTHLDTTSPKIPEVYVETEGHSPSSGDSEETPWISVEHKSLRKRTDSESSRDTGHSDSRPFRGHHRGNFRGRGSRSMEKDDQRFRDGYRARSNSDKEGYHRGRGRGNRDGYYRGRGHEDGQGSFKGQGEDRGYRGKTRTP